MYDFNFIITIRPNIHCVFHNISHYRNRSPYMCINSSLNTFPFSSSTVQNLWFNFILCKFFHCDFFRFMCMTVIVHQSFIPFYFPYSLLKILHCKIVQFFITLIISFHCPLKTFYTTLSSLRSFQISVPQYTVSILTISALLTLNFTAYCFKPTAILIFYTVYKIRKKKYEYHSPFFSGGEGTG